MKVILVGNGIDINASIDFHQNKWMKFFVNIIYKISSALVVFQLIS